MKAFIQYFTYYLPDNIITNNDLFERFPGLKINELTRLTGVLERRHASINETSSDLAYKCAEQLFSENNIDRNKVDYLIFCSSLSDYITPPTSCILQDRLLLKNNIGTFDYNQGCTGYIYGLSTAKGLIESGQASNVLLLTAETISKRIHKEDRSNQSIFGDGASATLISVNDNGAEIGDFVFGTDGKGYETIIIKHGGARFPYPEAVSTDYKDQYGNIRNDGSFYMNGSGVFSFSVTKAPEMIFQLLEKAGLDKKDIKLFILHQANRIILETIFKKLNISKEQEFYCLKRWGNTVQSTIPIALKEAINQKRISRGDKVLLAGFGVGFSWAGTIIQF